MKISLSRFSILTLSILVFTSRAHAACDGLISSATTFRNFESAANSLADTDGDGVATLCVKPYTIISPSSTTDRRIEINRSNLVITTDTGQGYFYVFNTNMATGYNSFYTNSGISLKGQNLSISNGLFLTYGESAQGVSVETGSLVRLISKSYFYQLGNSSRGINVAWNSRVDEITDNVFYSLIQNPPKYAESQGIFVISSIIGAIKNSSFYGSEHRSKLMSIWNSQVGVIDGANVTGGGAVDIGGSDGSPATVGVIRNISGSLIGRNNYSSQAFVISRPYTKVGLIDHVTATCSNTLGGAGLVIAHDSDVGAMKNLTLSSYDEHCSAIILYEKAMVGDISDATIQSKKNAIENYEGTIQSMERISITHSAPASNQYAMFFGSTAQILLASDVTIKDAASRWVFGNDQILIKLRFLLQN